MHLQTVELLDDAQQQDHDCLFVVLLHTVSDADLQNLVLQSLLLCGQLFDFLFHLHSLFQALLVSKINLFFLLVRSLFIFLLCKNGLV